MLSEKIFLRTQVNKKLFTAIALLSLVVGIYCISLLLAFVISEYETAHGNPNEERLFRMQSDYPDEEARQRKILYFMEHIAKAMKELYPEIEDVCLIEDCNHRTVSAGDIRANKLKIIATTPSFAQFFPLSSTGEPLNEMLAKPGKAAINTKTAQLLFGTENAIGKTFKLAAEGESKEYEVAAIIHHSQVGYMQTDILLPYENKFGGGVCFLLLHDKKEVVQLTQKFAEDQKQLPVFANNFGNMGYYIQPSSEVYFDTNFYEAFYPFILTRDKMHVYIALAAILILLLITAFNYINMSLTSAFQRIRIIGIQKAFGADSRHIIKMILAETFGMVALSFIVAIGFVCLSFPLFNNFFAAHLTLQQFFNPFVLLSYVAMIILLVLIPAGYIIRRVATANPAAIFRANSGKQKNYLIGGMLSIQFFISIFLAILSWVVIRQIHYMGARTNINPNLVEILDDNYSIQNPAFDAFSEEVAQLPGVELTNKAGEKFFYPWMISSPNEMILYHYSDSMFLKIFNLKLIDGTNLTNSLAVPRQIIVNEAFLKKHNVSQPAVGQIIKYYESEWKICGVVTDFVNEFMLKEPTPTYITGFPKEHQGVGALRVLLHPERAAETLKNIQVIWEKFFPQQIFQYSFLQEEYWDYNQKYIKQFNMITAFCLISVFLTCLGLFGFACYAVETRNREIGLRKVNGATSGQILWLFLRRFVGRAFIAWLIAAPLAYYIATKWLQEFTFKTDLSLWIFVGVGALTMVLSGLIVAWQSIQASLINPAETIKNE